MLQGYCIFHLNLAYSSIEEEQRAKVIRCCYWPLLHLVSEFNVPLGIEASAFTLEAIAVLEPEWLKELRRLCFSNAVEFVGSGYSQLIGPLVPAEVNRANQGIGLQVYEELLGMKPRLALVNEQAYSAGLVQHYLDAGYEAIVMDWDNPSGHHDWDRGLRYMPQYALGPDGERIPVIWSKSVSFQKFQRYAHGELELEDYLAYLKSHITTQVRAFALYANDTEIFDFRPGRYDTEPPQWEESEWKRIETLFLAILRDNQFQLILPSRVLDLLPKAGAGNVLHLESARQPVPVKKQGKYNITRWAVTGRDDLRINTECWRLYRRLVEKADSSSSDWKELCYLWSSDFRTHITETRWTRFNDRLESMKKRHPASEIRRSKKDNVQADPPKASPFRIDRRKHFLEIQTRSLELRLNTRRGLAIDKACTAVAAGLPLLCSLPHGYFDDIALGADFYTGHLVFEIPGRPKVTDLNSVEPNVGFDAQGLSVEGIIKTPFGNVIKRISIPPDRPEFTIQYILEWKIVPLGALRIGNITLNPEVFDSTSLFYRTHNGGFEPETFLVGNRSINHLAPVMPLVSASQGLGVTEGVVELGDNNKSVRIEADRCAAALTGHIVYHPSEGGFLFRLVFSASEVDDTCQYSVDREMFPKNPISLRVILPSSDL